MNFTQIQHFGIFFEDKKTTHNTSQYDVISEIRDKEPKNKQGRELCTKKLKKERSGPDYWEILH